MRFTTLLAALAITCIPLVSAEAGDKPAPTWNCLPAETMGVMHFPDTRGFVDALRDRTKIGQTIVTPQRLERCMAFFRDEAGDEWEEMVAELDRYGLKVDDWKRCLAGSAGVAGVPVMRPGRDPLWVMLFWFETEGDLADRLQRALELSLEEAEAQEEQIRRYDLELSSHPVIHLAYPDSEQDLSALEDRPDNWSDMTEDQRRDWRKARWEEIERAPRVMTDMGHFLITRLGTRIIIAANPPQSAEHVEMLRESGQEDIDFDEISGLEPMTGLFARFLAAHESGDSDGYAAKLSANAAVSGSLPAGKPYFEMYGNMAQLVQMLETASEGDEELMQGLDLLGFRQLGTFAVKFTLDGQLMRSGMFMEIPAPRSGLMKLLEQNPLESTPPKWVPSSVVSYAHFSFNAQMTYDQIKEIASAEGGPQVKQGFLMVEGMMPMTVGVEMPALLGSIGERISIVSFEPSGDPSALLDEDDASNTRTAFVFELSDMDVWKTLFGKAKEMLGGAAAQDGLTIVEDEQGFSGFRVEEGGVEVDFLFGHGHLLMAVGDGVAAELCTAMRKPPEGDAGFAGTSVVTQGSGLINGRPSLMYQVTDTDRQMTTIMDMLREAVADELRSSGEAGMAEKVGSIFPTRQEWKGVFGVSIMHAYLSEAGLVLDAAMKMGSKE